MAGGLRLRLTCVEDSRQIQNLVVDPHHRSAPWPTLGMLALSRCGSWQAWIRARAGSGPLGHAKRPHGVPPRMEHPGASVGLGQATGGFRASREVAPAAWG